MIKRHLIFKLTVTLLSPIGIAHAQTERTIRSPKSMIVSWSDGRILFEKNADDIQPIASISKLMAAVIIDEDCNILKDKILKISTDDPPSNMAKRHSDLKSGWRVAMTDLMHAALMRSDNLAIPAISAACGIKSNTLTERMNRKAKNMGLHSTIFAEPNGLSSKNVSTAREVIDILRMASERPQLRNIMIKKSHWILALLPNQKTIRYEIKNTNQIAGQQGFNIISGKTGFTNAAGHSLAIALNTLTHGNVGMVFLGATTNEMRFKDVENALRLIGDDIVY